MRMSRKLLLLCGVALLLTACGGKQSGGNQGQSKTLSEQEKNASTKERESITIKSSPDKYTWYIKDYVGKNVASVGYTSMGGNRMDSYGDGYLKLILVNEEGNYIDINNEDEMKKYVVADQNIVPNTEMKYTFPKDEEGNEEDTFPESQSYEEIVLLVKEIENKDSKERKLTEILASPDKYTKYIRDYTGRNLADCGYISMGGDFRDAYGDSTIKFILVTNDGSYVDVSDKEVLKRYTVKEQNIKPNTELKLEFLKDETGMKETGIVESQNISEIELHVSVIDK